LLSYIARFGQCYEMRFSRVTLNRNIRQHK